MSSTSAVIGTEHPIAPPADPARGTRLRRNLAVAAAAGTAVIGVVNGLTDVATPDDKTALLAGVATHPTRTAISIVSFILLEITSAGAALGVAALLRQRAPRLGAVAALLVVVGTFAHAVYGGIGLTTLAMATDPAHRAAYAGLLRGLDTQPYVAPFAVLGLVGVIVGRVLLSIAVIRARVARRWVIAVLLWAYLLLDFVGSDLVGALEYVAVVLAAAAWGLLGVEMLRRWPAVD